MILGIDEVGRGPWAGPLVIGAVILPEEKPKWVDELNDSKKLSAKKREELSALILKEAPASALGWVSSRELDSIGMSKALCLAARRAVENIQAQKIPFNEIIIDGTVNFLSGTRLENYVTILKKADFLIKEVSAASIIAKVARDSYMAELDKVYPGYDFSKHVGYGTAAHRQKIKELGPTPEHRVSFKPLQTYKTTTTKQIGDRAENIVAEYLENEGHQIIARNHKTPFYEIDIISIKENTIYFTEVKYRKDSYRGSSIDMITDAKLKQMTYAAESFLKFQPYFKNNYSPLLAAASVSGPDFHFDEWFYLSE